MADGWITAITFAEYGLTFFLGVMYFALLITVAVLTWRKGHKWLFFLGFLFPFLWLIGAILAPGGGIDYGMHSTRH